MIPRIVAGGALLVTGSSHVFVPEAPLLPLVEAAGFPVAAIYAHVAIDVWPNPETGEPPMALPVAVLLIGAYVAWRGAGRWSLDHRLDTRGR